MQAHLLFDLPEDQERYDITSKAINLWSVVNSIREGLRGRLKYNSQNYSADELKAIEDIYDELWGLIEGNGCQELF
jgi:hypothetical protein